MIEQIIPYVIFLAALGCGLIAGVFFAFSSFVMTALAKLPAKNGIAAMQSINITVLNKSFLTIFMGTALATVLLIVHSILNIENTNAFYLITGSLFYLIGSFLVTVVGNVPLNDALARVRSEEETSVLLWKNYLSKWSRWNHIRTLASLVALAFFILALS